MNKKLKITIFIWIVLCILTFIGYAEQIGLPSIHFSDEFAPIERILKDTNTNSVIIGSGFVMSIIVYLIFSGESKAQEKKPTPKIEPSIQRPTREPWYSTIERPKYFRPLTAQDIKELQRLGAKAYPSPRQWIIPESLDHLPKEEVWKMLQNSYRELFWEYFVYKGFKWLFENSSASPHT